MKCEMRNAKCEAEGPRPLHFALRISHFAFGGSRSALRISHFVFYLCLSVFICGSLLSCSRQPATPTVYVVSPHASDIRLEFTKAFAAWHKQKYGYEVAIQWPDYGGTSDIVRYLGTQYAKADSCGYDVFFGGGSGTFDQLTQLKYLAKAPLSPEAFANAAPDRPGIRLRGPDDLWFAATLSNFGIVINKDRLHELAIPEPQTWADLAAPQWLGHLSLADPSKSGSVRTAYEMMLQQNGWEKGWSILSRMFANADAIKDSGSAPAEETDLGNTAGGVVIDFFARNHMAKLGPDVIGFVVPVGGSALDSDPIAMLKGAPHPELAAHLIEFVISPEGQKIWTFKPRTPGGPLFKPLGRLSVHESLYRDFPQYLFDPTNPFEKTGNFKLDKDAQEARSRFLGDLLKAALIDTPPALAAARAALKKNADPPPSLAILTALPHFSIPASDLAIPSAASDKLKAALTKLQSAATKLDPSALTAGLTDRPLTSDCLPLLALYYTLPDPGLQERIRTDLRDSWRRDYAIRCQTLLAHP